MNVPSGSAPPDVPSPRRGDRCAGLHRDAVARRRAAVRCRRSPASPCPGQPAPAARGCGRSRPRRDTRQPGGAFPRRSAGRCRPGGHSRRRCTAGPGSRRLRPPGVPVVRCRPWAAGSCRPRSARCSYRPASPHQPRRGVPQAPAPATRTSCRPRAPGPRPGRRRWSARSPPARPSGCRYSGPAPVFVRRALRRCAAGRSVATHPARRPASIGRSDAAGRSRPDWPAPTGAAAAP